MPIRTLRSLVAAALTVSLAACSTPPRTTSASPAPSTSSPSPAPTPTVVRHTQKRMSPYSTTPFVGEPVISQDVTQRFGDARAVQTYESVVAYMRAESLDMDRLRSKRKYAESDFASAGRPMIPPTREYWRKKVSQALKGSDQAAAAVRKLAFWNMETDGFKFTPAGPPVVDERVDQAKLTIDKDYNWLSISVTYSAWLRLTRAKVAYRQPIGKQMTFVVIPGAKSWLLISYSGTWNIGNVMYE
ncbi:hypothetical protein M1L60_22255 [Actinoplanes sp. TRM 88003]|uniref:Lipoprotein n=1 Tax=Paractinoplanes aksuensis TaxID=2939490 RepID=A0ABT1DR64_9ACTN|nr:hypothetical protein [Actinoplanes aksuensis]MCO8273320.1 hypothetical protein [Actinoplanes aksuensis]